MREGPLRDLAEIAYLRFGSFYRAVDSLEDFVDEFAPLSDECPGWFPPELPTTPVEAGTGAAKR